MRADDTAVSDREVNSIARYVNRVLPIATASLPDEYFYSSLPLCVIDAVWSLGVRYSAVQHVITRYCDYSQLRRLRLGRRSLPPPAEQEPLRAFCAKIERIGPEAAASEIFGNRQRTSSTAGILKADAVHRFACTLRAHNQTAARPACGHRAMCWSGKSIRPPKRLGHPRIETTMKHYVHTSQPRTSRLHWP